MVTYIVFIYQNCVNPNLGEYFLKLSYKSVHNHIVKVDRAHPILRKSAQTFFTPKLAKISKKEDQVVAFVF